MSSLRSLIKTTPVDKKLFPASNQAHYCWQKYNEYVLCVKKNDGDEDACTASRQLAYSICPEEWLQAWKEQRANGVFLGVQEREEVEVKAHDHH